MKDFPIAPKLKKLLGPSFILLGLGLGSGELILWPYLAANFGLGIIWGAAIGITLQFFLNTEISRYTLVTGESVFMGLFRKLKIFSPIWFILSTLIPWMWPGIIAASATLFSASLGISYNKFIPIIFLLLIGIILSLGPVLYKTQELLQKIVIFIGVPFVFGLSIYLSQINDFANLALGLIGKGNGFWFLPSTIPLATFLGALAYAGAGGNLNLGQSLYIKEKGYGMGKFSGRITSILTGKKENILLTGTDFEENQNNKTNFFDWWKKINLEHALVFWGTGLITMLLLALLSYATVYGQKNTASGINFVIYEASAISTKTFPILGTMFLIISTIMLFFTQMGVLATTSRIMTENLCILSKKLFPTKNIPFYFYGFLWTQIFLGIIIFLIGFTEPLALVITSAVLNAFSMFFYSILILWLNSTIKYKFARPNLFRKLMILVAFFFYGGFSLFVIWQNLI